MAKNIITSKNNPDELDFVETSPEIFEFAITQATKRNETWKHNSQAEKAVLLEKVAKLMQNKKDRLSIFLKLEMIKLLALN